MDLLTSFLSGARAAEAFLLRIVMEPPWAIRIEDHAPLTVLCVVSGTATVIPDGPTDLVGGPRRLGSGDVAVVRGPEPYTVADDASTAPTVVVHEGERCETLEGEPLAESMALGVRTWGNDPQGSTTLLIGTYQSDGELSRRLLGVLPPVIALGADDWSCPLVPLLAEEIAADHPGQAAVLDRLLDLLTVAALRAWFARRDLAPGWYLADADPVVGPALRALHDEPERPWTVESLARAANVSRAALARRFTALVGEPPITYLTRYRLALGADLLHDPDTSIATVAERVGYASPFSFSTAFRREYGHSPRAHRQLAC